MLRSASHWKELLQSRPSSQKADEFARPEYSRSVLPSRKRFNPGFCHLIRYYNVPGKICVSAGQDVNLRSRECGFRYSRKLESNDCPAMIRLLKVFPGHKNDPIKAELRYVSAERPPYFQAVSYCWDSQTPTIEIECDAQTFLVTENLGTALVALRQRFTSTLLWADAICIDQTSIEEKNCQVALMPRIYSQAAVVQIWLGEYRSSTVHQEAFQLLRLLDSANRDLEWDFDIFTAQPGKIFDFPALKDRSWLCLIQLLHNPWFSRAWIIQETVLAQKAVLRCGSLELDWEVLRSGIVFALRTNLLLMNGNAFESARVYQRLMALITTDICFKHEEYPVLDLPSLLQSHRFVEATDVRDKVYALLGLSVKTDNGDHGLLANYSITVPALYIQVTKAIIQQSSSLDILGVPRKAVHPYIDDVPSWAVDWNSLSSASSLSSKALCGKYIFDFNASGLQHHSRVTFRGTSLILQGQLFEVIKKVGKLQEPYIYAPRNDRYVIDDPPLGPGTFAKLMNVLLVFHNWRQLNDSRSLGRPYPSIRQSLDHEFYRTLTLNSVRGSGIDENLYSFDRHYPRWLTLIVYYLLQLAWLTRLTRLWNWYERQFTMSGLVMGIDNSTDTLSEVLCRTAGRRLIVTSKGFLGLAPELARPGHHIALIKGSKVPLVLAEKANGKWELIGDCYVHGIMYGEAFEESMCVQIEVI